MSKRTRIRSVGTDDTTGKPDDVADDTTAASDDGSPIGGNIETVSATVDPASVGPTAEPSTDSKPRRGRPPGSGTGQKQTKKISSLVNVNGLEKLLVGIHGGLAILSGHAEWMLDTENKIFDGQTEAEFLASSVKAVTDHYGTGFLDQKTLDWCNAIQCVMIVYGGRIFAIRSKPRTVKIRQPTVHEAARTHSPVPPQQAHTPQPAREFNGHGNNEAGRVDLPGLGAVEFPDDNPLSPNFKPKFN